MSRLVLVPTPIGNLDDITLRALDALRDAEVVAAEDTRRSGGLLAHHGITTPLVRLDAHTVRSRAPAILAKHERVAYVSDAGSPGVSDPGAELVRLALSHGAHVEALPGATAFVPALVLSGLPVARFTFEGFLPRKGGDRTRRLGRIARRDHPSVLYESPHRLAATLDDVAGACGGTRAASVSRELTKRFEQTVRGSLAELAAWAHAHPPRGEMVVVIGPRDAPDDGVGEDAGGSRRDAADTAMRLASAGVRGRTLADALRALGVPRNEAYRAAQEADRTPDDG